MEFITEHWRIVYLIVIAIAVAAVCICRFFGKPTAEQLDNVREWLLWAVTNAEKELGGGTGKLKLRQVYDLFVTRFPTLVRLIPFEMFSQLVDEALIEMRDLLDKNKAVAALVTGTTDDAKEVAANG